MIKRTVLFLLIVWVDISGLALKANAQTFAPSTLQSVCGPDSYSFVHIYTGPDGTDVEWRYNTMGVWYIFPYPDVVSSYVNETYCGIMIRDTQTGNIYTDFGGHGSTVINLPPEFDNVADTVLLFSCAVEMVLPLTAEHAQYFAMLYRLRDEIFTQTDFGNRLIDIHHQYASEAAQILLTNSRSRLLLIETLKSTAPAVVSIVEGDGNVILTAEMLIRMEAYINSVAGKASPEMQQALLTVWKDANLWAYKGMAVDQVWDALNQ